MSKRKFTGNFSSKGYYIALILCVIAIGISGYLYYKNANQNDPTLQNPPATDGQNIPVIATDPDADPGDATEPSENKDTKLQTVSPVQGEVVAVYAADTLTYNQTTRDWRTHNGIDIAAEAGTAVGAAADGTVYTVYEDETMGTTVVLRHEGGYMTRYASLAEEVSVAPGDTVTAGQQLGTVGQSALLECAIGDHVHFSVTCDGEDMNPSDFLDQ